MAASDSSGPGNNGMKPVTEAGEGTTVVESDLTFTDKNHSKVNKIVVVGIDASAVEFEPLVPHLGELQTDTGLAYFVIPRQSSEFDGMMKELLSQHTQLPIQRDEDGLVVKPSFLVDEQYELLFTFPGAGNFLAQRGKEVSDSIFEMVADDLKVVLTEALQRCSQQNSLVKISNLPLHRAGETIVADLSVEPLAIDSQTRLFIVTIIPADNTPLASDRRNGGHERDADDSMREGLRQTQDELSIAKDAIHAAINGVLLTDLDWKIRTANPSFLKMFELGSFDELKGQRIPELVSSEIVDRLKAICEKISEDKSPAKHEYTLRRNSGTTFQVEVAATIFNDEFGNPRGRHLSFVDITRRRSAEKTREIYAADLEMANETLRIAEVQYQAAVEKRDQFLAILSHELRNPLGGIQNAVRVLNHPDSDGSNTERAKQAIANQSAHMARLMNDLLDVSRVTQGKINFDIQVFDVRDVVDDVRDSVQSSLLTKKQEFEVFDCEEPIFIEADRDRLLQIMNNLLTNASRYTPVGGNIALHLESDGIACVISVVDDGQGIEDDLKDSIFEMFVQSDATLDRADGGMGVGLTLVRSLVEKMNGSIVVESEGAGKGSKFVVRLPLSSKDPRPDEQPLFGSSAGQNTREKTVLIVEDNLEALEMLKCLLALDGFNVLTATDGKKGLEAIVAKQPDIALVDIGLPKLDGFQVAVMAREKLGDRLKTKLIALTGYGQKDDHEKIMASGFVEHLVKPVDVKELDRVLKS